MKTQPLHIFGVAMGNGAGDIGCQDGPQYVEKLLTQAGLPFPYQWQKTYVSPSRLQGLSAMDVICNVNTALADAVARQISANTPFLVVGGDQTCSLGTWSATRIASEPVGLIWLDAHMDAHTPETTASGNIHGMPLAALLGFGDDRMTHLFHDSVKLSPQQVVLIGIRSFEREEARLLAQLGVRVFYMEEVIQKGMPVVLQEAKDHVAPNNKPFAVTLDLDAVDPVDAPGVGTPEPGGIRMADLCQAIAQIDCSNLMGAEIVEFNPHRDQDSRTIQSIQRVINALFSRMYQDEE